MKGTNQTDLEFLLTTSISSSTFLSAVLINPSTFTFTQVESIMCVPIYIFNATFIATNSKTFHPVKKIHIYMREKK